MDMTPVIYWTALCDSVREESVTLTDNEIQKLWRAV